MTALRLAVAAAEELPAVVKAVAKELPPLAKKFKDIPASEVVDLVATSKPALREVKNVVSGNGISLNGVNGVLKNGVKAIKDHPFQTAV